MTRSAVESILVIGADPASMGEIGPQPPGMTTQDVYDLIDRQGREIGELAGQVLTSLVARDGTSVPDLGQALDSRPWDLIVVGAGIHRAPPFLAAFEDVMNLLHAHPQQRGAVLAFAQSVAEVTDAARRKVQELRGA